MSGGLPAHGTVAVANAEEFCKRFKRFGEPRMRGTVAVETEQWCKADGPSSGAGKADGPSSGAKQWTFDEFMERERKERECRQRNVGMWNDMVVGQGPEQ
jgi:hypothetical protein